jgi:hypothetical protein
MQNLRNCWTRVLLPGFIGAVLAVPGVARAQASTAAHDAQPNFQMTPFTYSALFRAGAVPASISAESYSALYLHPVRTYLSGNRVVRSLGHSAETNAIRLWNLRLDFNRRWNPDPQSPAALSAAAVPGLPSNVGMQ